MNDDSVIKEEELELSDKALAEDQALKYAQDISSLYKLEREERKQLILANRQLKAYAQKLELVNSELKDFLFTASHGLQEPLRKAMVFSDLVEHNLSAALDKKGKDYLERMRNAISNMQSKIYGLLEYSKIGCLANEQLKLVDFGAVVKGVVNNLQEQIRTSQGQVKAESMPVIYAYDSQIRQLFESLIENALKFSDKGKSPTVFITSCLLPDNFWEIQVQDNGRGFEEKYLGQVMKPFNKLENNAHNEGAGIGLTLCNKIVLNHGGRIRINSVPGKGSTVFIMLPDRSENSQGKSGFQEI